jgi:hypothetical protein
MLQNGCGCSVKDIRIVFSDKELQAHSLRGKGWIAPIFHSVLVGVSWKGHLNRIKKYVGWTKQITVYVNSLYFVIMHSSFTFFIF